MPTAAEIQQYFVGVWRMMMGRSDGLKLLDLSADGFWNSFFAIPLALPALFAGWIAASSEYGMAQPYEAGRAGIVLRLAVIDLASWVVPYVLLALVARPAGIADRFATFVVASNWGSALLVWMLLPPILLTLLMPGLDDIWSPIALLLFLMTLVLIWRLTNVAIGKGPAVATAVFVAMFAASLTVLFTLEGVFGLSTTGG